MLEAQLGDKAKYSHHANSSFGIPFDILDLHRETLKKSEWKSLILDAPKQVSKPLPKENIYVVEADCDRPGEGEFLAKLLRPEVVLWVSTARTHSMNFDELVSMKMFSNVDEAIAFEYGYFAEFCQKLLLVDEDSPLEIKQLERTTASVKKLKVAESEKNYTVTKTGTTFHIGDKTYTFTYLLPRKVLMSLMMCQETLSYLQLPFDNEFSTFALAPGRGSIFEGIKETTLIDSSYNASPESMKAMLELFKEFPGDNKWVVVGDMLELGNEEKEEHEKLAEELAAMHVEKILLIGPRVSEFTYAKLKDKVKIPIETFTGPKELLTYLTENINGKETIFFKGARFLEGVIEHLLKNSEDVAKLPRREQVWEERRTQWGV